VKLGTHGASVSLLPVGYQYPHLTGGGAQDWDANWLIIAGDVRTDGGRTWSFTDPCMTTWDAARLGEWLREVLSGAVEPVPADRPGTDQLLVFTEPTVALSVASRRSAGIVLRVHLSLEAGPPVPGGHDEQDNAADIFDYFVPVAMSVADLAAAVSTWEHDLASFPAR